jgi:DNA polymerase-3 subunit beta
MKVTVNTKEFLGNLKVANMVVPRNPTLAIIKNVLLTARGKELVITGTNLDVRLRVTCKAKVSGDGQVVVSPAVFNSFAGTSTTELMLELKGDKLLISDGEFQFHAETCKPEDFPDVSMGTPLQFFKSKELLSGINMVKYAVSKEDCRPVLQGICFQPDGKKMHLVAADGFRLAKTTIPIHVLNGEIITNETIVPQEAINLITRLFKGDVSVGLQPGKTEFQKATFNDKNIHLTTNLISGSFPKWQELIPNTGTRITLAADKALNSIKRLLKLKPDADRIDLSGKKGSITLTCKNDNGEMSCKLPIVKGSIKTSFNGNYLKDLFTLYDGKTITMTTGIGKKQSAPAMLKEGKTVHLLMPMFIKPA